MNAQERKSLTALRESKGMTQVDVAKVLGITAPAYCRKEKGVRPLFAHELQQLATLFDVSLDSIELSTQNLTVSETTAPAPEDLRFQKWVDKVRNRGPQQ